jgi:periplasmic protein TonB
MSYAQRKDLSGNPMLAWFFTIVVVGGLLYAIVTGLAFNVIKKGVENLKVIDVEEPPPPPDKPPPPPKDMPKVPPPPMQPPPLIRFQAPPPPIQTVTSPVIPPVAPPVMSPPQPPPPPPPPRRVEPAHARANLGSYVTDDDYPPAALSAGQEGNTGFRLDVGPDGRVTNCTITSSSGSTALDSATCRIMRSRAKFTPARDSNGNATSDSVTASIRWQIRE